MITQRIKAWYIKIPYSLKVAILVLLIAKLAVFSIGYAAASTTAGETSTAPFSSL